MSRVSTAAAADAAQEADIAQLSQLVGNFEEHEDIFHTLFLGESPSFINATAVCPYMSASSLMEQPSPSLAQSTALLVVKLIGPRS